MVALILSGLLAVAGAAGVEVPGGKGRAPVMPEIPRLERPALSLTTALAAQIPAIPSIPDATGDSRPLELPASAAALAQSPASASKARDAVPSEVLAMPGLEALAEAVKPGAALTERAFSRTFDGLRSYRAPRATDRVDLDAVDPDDSGEIRGKKQAIKKLGKDQEKLDELQQVLYADRRRRVLIVLQGMDTAGKDGVIRHVLRSLNPQGVQVASFKKPTDEEKKHHFLWRIARALPAKGMIGVFNRSQYEDILVPSVHPEWYPEMTSEDLDARYETINAFEKALAAGGWTIVKFYLHISKDEQRARLQERIDNPAKNWKFSREDLKTRKDWDKYIAAYEKILARTNTPWAPWYVIPANDKRYRDFLVGRILKKTLKRLKLRYPPPDPTLKEIKVPG